MLIQLKHKSYIAEFQRPIHAQLRNTHKNTSKHLHSENKLINDFRTWRRQSYTSNRVYSGRHSRLPTVVFVVFIQKTLYSVHMMNLHNIITLLPVLPLKSSILVTLPFGIYRFKICA